jgi:hypothetical protein
LFGKFMSRYYRVCEENESKFSAEWISEEHETIDITNDSFRGVMRLYYIATKLEWHCLTCQIELFIENSLLILVKAGALKTTEHIAKCLITIFLTSKESEEYCSMKFFDLMFEGCWSKCIVNKEVLFYIDLLTTQNNTCTPYRKDLQRVNKSNKFVLKQMILEEKKTKNQRETMPYQWF